MSAGPVLRARKWIRRNPVKAVATGAVETRHIVYPLREMSRHRQIRFHKNKVERIDLESRRIHLHNELDEPFDTLVIALGSVVPPAERVFQGRDAAAGTGRRAVRDGRAGAYR